MTGSLNTSIRMEMISKFLLLVAVLLLFVPNLIKGLDYRLANLLLFLIGISSLFFLFNRDYYLPFLGRTFFPQILPKDEPSGDVEVKVTGLPKNTKVIFWASFGESDTIGTDPTDAYGNYSNSGITQTDNNGNASFYISCPIEYKVPGKSTPIPKHIHYRYEYPSQPGFFSKIETKYITDEC
jgi:hypothetical protein